MEKEFIGVEYLYKKEYGQRPEYLEHLQNVYSMSSCATEDFTNYIDYWKHNGYWVFDSPQVMQDLALQAQIDLSDMLLFYYEAYPLEYNEDTDEWREFFPESSFLTNITPPINKQLEGFDIVVFSMGNMPECSPLLCNGLVEHFNVNGCGLFNTFQEAKQALPEMLGRCEPGPYRIIAVYAVT